MCVIDYLVLCYLNSPGIYDFSLLHARESNTCKSVVENCLYVIFFPSSFKISCVAAFYTDSLSQFCVLTLLLIFSWVLIITSLSGSRVPAPLELSLCCCYRHVMIPESKHCARFPLGVAVLSCFGGKSVSPLTTMVASQDFHNQDYYL